MPDARIYPLHPPDIDETERRVNDLVSKLPRPPETEDLSVRVDFCVEQIYAVRGDLIRMRLYAARYRDSQDERDRNLSTRLDSIDETLTAIRKHIDRRDSVSNEVQLEHDAKIKEAKATAAEAKTLADRAWAAVGKGGALSFAGGGVVALIKYLFF